MVNNYQVQKNTSLRPLNTFGMDAAAAALIEINAPEQLALVAADTHLQQPFSVLGGGSNVLLTGDVTGTVLLNRIKGLHLLREDEHHVWIQAGGGEIWHELVLFAIGNGWGGIENLALIPGTVGAAPIQNIGAYGVEVKDTIEEVRFWDMEQRDFRQFRNESCRFGYRDSIFKQELRGKVFITEVTFRLKKNPQLNTGYGAIRDELEAMGVSPSVQNVAQAVINIRRSKLPDPAQIGNAGSFFKNPTIPQAQFDDLKTRYPDLPSYPAGPGLVKVPAGWLIEQCGLKGFREEDAGVHSRQALVLVNYGTASGAQIWALSQKVLDTVEARFGIVLEREVQVW